MLRNWYVEVRLSGSIEGTHCLAYSEYDAMRIAESRYPGGRAMSAILEG